MPSPDNSPPELVFNISNILLSLNRKASIWKNCAFSQPASVPRGLPCSSETEVWVGWYFDTALETVHAQRLPEEPLGKGYPPEGRSERFTGIHSPDSASGEAHSSPPLLRDTDSARNSQPCVQAQCTTPGIQCFLLLRTRCNFIQLKLLVLNWRMGDWSKMHYRK